MLISLGLDFTHADVATRESFHLSDAEVEAAYARTPVKGVVQEFLAVNTCNRVELYGWAGDRPDVKDLHLLLAQRYFGQAAEAARFMSAATGRTGRDAVRHLLRVTAGLESQILGDIHILGQLRQAYRMADRVGVMGPNLHRLLDTAIRAGKAVKRETELMAGRSSVASEAVQLAERRMGGLQNRRCVVVGCGKIGTHTVQSLVKLGVRDIVLMNRTRSRAEELARTRGGRTEDWSRFNEVVAGADAVFVATGARQPILGAPALRSLRSPEADPLLIVDVSMPRNVFSDVRDVPGVELVDLDQLHPEAASVARARKAAVPHAEALVADHVEEFMAWQASFGAREALRPLREALEEICLREIDYATGGDADVNRAATRIVSKLLARPMTVLREEGDPQDIESITGAMRLLFTTEDGRELSPKVG
ncbi:MAG: glutamyl-tRNA reductase [Gemmatimonadota bacterium]